MHLDIPHDEPRLMAMLHEVAEVYEQRTSEEGTLVTAWIPRGAMHRFEPYAAARLLKRAKVS